MAVADIDISWQVLRQIVHDWAGSHVELDEVKHLDGGSIATTVELHTKPGDRAVLKITPHRVDRSYVDEAHQLAFLRELGLPAPRVYRYEIGSLDLPFSYLLMEHRDGVDLARAKAACSPEQFDVLQVELARVVRTLHAQTHAQYHRVSAGECSMFDSWPAFYRDVFDPIWQEVEKNGHLPPKSRKLVARIHERLPALLAHDDCPRLLHGDLWTSNILAGTGKDGAWHITAILDPYCKYGHVECEIAYLELFHTVNGAFMRAYQGEHHLPNDYHRLRKPVYQLYELLNHLQLFGHEYLKPTIAAIERVSQLI
jgi:fructosamine-3-kinase